MSLLVSLTNLIRPHTADIALAMVATLLVIFGDHINDAVRRLVKGQPIWARVGVFIALCTFGYGALSVWLTPILKSYLQTLSAGEYLAIVVGGFLLVGILAERHQKGR